MKDRILALIDPAGRLRSASSLLRSLQVHEYSSIEGLLGSRRQVSSSLCIVLDADLLRLEAVSYTHLTLPTICSV